MTQVKTINKDKCKPFLRWPGGKRWLSSEIVRLADATDFNRYFEPFLGGGATYFDLQPKNAFLSDVNSELICTYNAVKFEHVKLIEILMNLPVSKEKYYEMRSTSPIEPVDIAVRFLYLNRLAFAGMYRVNQNGQFNVPYGDGRRVDVLWSDGLLERAAQALQNATIEVKDFEDAISNTGAGDFVYCDPTYTVSHNTNGFIRYNEKVFKWEDQVRLSLACIKAVERGATVVVSNAAHSSIAELYPTPPKIVKRFTCISGQNHGRREIEEYLFHLFPAML